MKKAFTSLDASLSGYLTLKGFIPKLIKQGDKVVCAFDASNELYNAINDYNSGVTVEAVRFVLVVKNLESQIDSIKNKIGL